MAKNLKTKTPVIKVTVPSSLNTETALDRIGLAFAPQDQITGVLDPPYNPKRLVEQYDLSAVLPQHIDAIVTNVDSYGHKFLPAIDLYNSDAEERIRRAMQAEGYELADTEQREFIEPKPAEVAARLEKLKQKAAIERNRAEAFFSSCCPDYSFIDFRMRLRLDERVTGNAYIEFLRDEKGRPSRMCLAPAINMRLCPKDTTPTTVDEWVRTSEISWERVKQQRYFRLFAEVDVRSKQIKAYFKEFGDPRVVCRRTGKIYATKADFDKDPDRKPDDQQATEIAHFAVPNPGSPYGVPQWMGNLPAVMGSRELDEVNLSYFENKTVPPLALLVNGGRLAKGVVPRIEEFVEQQVKGKKNFHKILIIEAEGQKTTAAGTTGIVPSLKFEPLREAQQQDALFQNYDERNWDKIASSFRLPRILVGRDRAINRATAIAAIRFAEEQVFEPIRSRFDEFINRRILPDIGIFFWRFRSNTPITRDPEMLAEIIATLADAGVITPAEARRYAGDVFNEELAVLNGEWTKTPLKILLAQIKAGLSEGDSTVDNTEPAEDGGGKRAGSRIAQRRSRMDAADAAPDPESERAPNGKNGVKRAD